MNNATTYTTSKDRNVTITVTDTSITFDDGEGSWSYRKGDAQWIETMSTIERQLDCGVTCADFLAAQHLFCEEQEVLAWLDFGVRLGMFVMVDKTRKLFAIAGQETSSNDDGYDCAKEDADRGCYLWGD